MKTKSIDVTGRSREELLIIAERACSALVGIANNMATDEGDKDATEDYFGIDAEYVVEMAHDNMIRCARATLDSIVREFPKSPSLSSAQRVGK